MRLKVVAAVAACAMSLGLLAGCAASGSGADAGGAGASRNVFVEGSTLGDYMGDGNQAETWSWGGGELEYTYRDGDEFVRVKASITEEQEDALDASAASPGGLGEAVKDAVVTSVDVYEGMGADELSALAGKIGKELVDEGFAYLDSDDAVSSMNGSALCLASKDGVDYLLTFTGEPDEGAADTAGKVAGLKLSEIEVEGISFSDTDSE